MRLIRLQINQAWQAVMTVLAMAVFMTATTANATDLIQISELGKGKLAVDKVAALRNFLFPANDSSAPKKLMPGTAEWTDELDSGFGVKTDAVVVVHKGNVIFEEYRNGYHKDMPHRLWSVGKSVTSSIIGMAVKEGKLSLADSICKYLNPPNRVRGTKHCDISVRNILHWSTSLKWQETYASLNPKRSSVLAMLYGEGHGDMADFVFGHEMEADAGKAFNYSTGDTNLLWAILQRVYSEEEYENLPWTMLFDRIGLSKVTLERDLKGLFSGGSHMFMTTRDLARYGQFFLNGGVYKGEKMLPENWREFSATLAPAMTGRGGSEPNGDNLPGAHWWVNQAVPERNIERPWPSGPEDTFAGLGVFGQTLMIVPSLDLVIVRLGQDLISGFDRDEFLKLSIELVK